MLWHSHSAAILLQRRSPAMLTIPVLSPALSNDTRHDVVHNELTTCPIGVARQTTVPPSTAAQVQVTTLASRLLVVQPYPKCLYCQKTLTAREILGKPSCHSFYITIRNFSHKAQHNRKHMVVAHTESAPPPVYHYQQNT